MLAREDADTERSRRAGRQQSRGKTPVPGRGRARGAAQGRRHRPGRACPRAARGELAELIAQLTDQMHAAAAELQFELAARLRDEISDLKRRCGGWTPPASASGPCRPRPTAPGHPAGRCGDPRALAVRKRTLRCAALVAGCEQRPKTPHRAAVSAYFGRTAAVDLSPS